MRSDGEEQVNMGVGMVESCRFTVPSTGQAMPAKQSKSSGRACGTGQG